MMIIVSQIQTTAPEKYQTELQKTVYETLAMLQIPWSRVETDEIITMEDCAAVNERLDMKMVKTLFLCNRQQTDFYLFVTCGHKPFSSKNFSAAQNISRVSFAPAEQMEKLLGTKIGAATIFSALRDTAREVSFVLDRDILSEPFYGCSDGTTTGYLKIPTEELLRKFLPYTQHKFQIIEV